MPRRYHGIILVRCVIAEINYALDEIPGRRGVTIQPGFEKGERGGRFRLLLERVVDEERGNEVNRVENRGSEEEWQTRVESSEMEGREKGIVGAGKEERSDRLHGE